MIDFHHIAKSFGKHDVLREVSFRVNAGEHVGITGPNGSGKSTIFNLLTGVVFPDSGKVTVPKYACISHLHQQLNPYATSASLLSYTENATGELNAIAAEINDLEARLVDPGARDTYTDDLSRLGKLQTRFEHLGGYRIRTRAEYVLTGLGFTADAFARRFSEFSGGWQMRAELARVLTASPDILLLDEPSNFLDVEAVEWLRSYLRSFDGIMLLISHDRYLLSSITSVTLEVANGVVERYNGNYAFYVTARTKRREQAEAAHRNQERKRQQIERFVERFRYKASKASQVQSRLKQLNQMDEVRLPAKTARAATIRVPESVRSGVEVIRIEEGGITYNGADWIFTDLSFRLERGTKAAIIGPNGMGKTSLLRVLAGQLPLNRGKRQVGTNVVIGYQAQDFMDVMNPNHSVFTAVREGAPSASESDVRHFLGCFGFSGDTVEKYVEILSGGEKVRLALTRLLLRAPNFILLDEPTTHLDIPTRQALEQALCDYQGTLCFVSHDIEFIRHVADTIYYISPEGITKYFGGYDYYREKQAAQLPSTSPQSARAIPSNKDTSAAGEDKPLTRKQERQKQANYRQEISQQQKPLRRRAEKAEAKVEKLQEEQHELIRRIQSEQADGGISYINRRLSQIQNEIDEATTEWEEAELAIEELQEQTADTGDNSSCSLKR